MAKNIDHIQHVKSSVVENGLPKLPLADKLVEGELAINYANGYETISIKNSSGNIITFSSDNYYTEKKLGSGFTGANSAITVTDAISNFQIDQVIDSGTSASTHAVSTAAVFDKIKEDEQVWALALNQLNNDISGHTANTSIHVTSANKTAWDAKLDSSDVIQTIDSATSASTNPVSSSAVYGFVTAYTPSITVDQEITSATSASTNAVATKVVAEIESVVAASLNELNDTKLEIADFNTYSGNVDTAINSKASQSSLNTLSGTVTAHTASTVHMDATEKENLDSLATNIAAISGITSTNVSNWNTAYTNNHTHSNKSALDAITGNVGTMAYENASSYSSATEVNTALGNKADTSAFTAHTADTTIHFTTGTVQTQINNSISGYADSVKYNDTNHHMEFYHGTTAGTKVYEFDASPFIIDGMVDDVKIENVAGSGTCLVVDFNTDAGKQDINIPISDIFDADNYYTKTDIDDKLGSGYTSSSITEVIEDMDTAIAAAITDLEDRKADTSAVTSAITDALTALTLASSAVTAMTGYAMAASGTPITSGDTLNQAIGKLEKMIDEFKAYIEQKELAIAAAITDLDDRIGNAEQQLSQI